MKQFILLGILLLFSINKISCNISKFFHLQTDKTCKLIEAQTAMIITDSNEPQYFPLVVVVYYQLEEQLD